MTPADIAILQRAFGLLGAGDVAGADRALRTLRAAMRQHPDALFVAAMIAKGQGQFDRARGALENALRAAPRHAQLWNAYGNLLSEMGQGAQAIAALQNAVQCDARYVEGWVNLAIVATQGEDWQTAGTAAKQATLLAPSDSRGWAATGALEQARGAPDAAEKAYRMAVQVNPHDLASRHNLATVLRDLDRREEALAVLEAAMAAGLTAPESGTTRAHLLAERGRFDDAVAQYRAVLSLHPAHLDAHETLASLLPQIGQGAAALDSYAAAAEIAGGSAAFWHSAVGSAKALGDGTRMLEWIDAGTAAIGNDVDLMLARSGALSMLGRRDEAMAVLEQVHAVAPDNAALHANFAYLKLAMGDAKGAEPHALRMGALMPQDQTSWALLTLIWRLMGDEREYWLAGYDRLVMPMDVPTPAGWSSRAAFLADVEQALTALHITTAHPAEQSLRGGTQTRGHLFDRQHPIIRALGESIRTAVSEALGALPVDPAHPFLSRNGRPWRFSGSWSVRLRDQGFHVSHIHTSGWVSSAFYASLPPEVAAGDMQADGAVPQGALMFGVPDASLGLDLSPRRIVQPVQGRLVIFPSYLWHGTAPFHSDHPRMTVAFDAVPAI